MPALKLDTRPTRVRGAIRRRVFQTALTAAPSVSHVRLEQLVPRLDPLDLEPRPANEFGWLSREVAPVGNPPLHRLEAPLPAGNRPVRGQAVLEKVEAAARPQDPAHLRQRRHHVGDRAEREREQGTVAAGIAQGNRLAVQPDMVNFHVGGGDAPLGDATGGRRRLHRVHPRDLGR